MDRLRAVAESDLDQILEWRNHPQVREMMYSQHVISKAEHRAWWAAQQGRADRQYMIFEADGLPLGCVSFTNIDPKNKKAEWAFYAGLPAPKGTGRRMERAALAYAFGTLGLNKLSCEVLRHNRRVIDLHRSFGFRIEGVFRDHVLIDGTYMTAIRLAIFARCWHEHEQSM